MPKVRKDFRSPLYESPVYEDLQARLVEHLKRLRREKGWTQTETATRLGMKVQQVQQLESGKNNATMVTLARLVETFEIDIVELLAPLPKPRETHDERKKQRVRQVGP